MTRPLSVLSVIGTRPEAIKMAPVLEALARRKEQFRSIVCMTGQHREMIEPALRVFEIVPDIDLDVMTDDQSLASLTSRLLERLDAVIEQDRPDWIIAQGDTTTVFAAALTAFYRSIPFAHVEAGLRTDDFRNPFPEEFNRRAADMTARLCCAPTERARRNLLREGCDESTIELTGNTIVDALYEIASKPYDWDAGPLRGLNRNAPIVLVTAHRRESFGEGIRQICLAIRRIADEIGDGVQLVYPVHLNPNVRGPVESILGDVRNVALLEPIDYVSLVNLLKSSTLVLTDSGGIQEEAVSLRIPVLVMREKTERPEGVEAGAALLVGNSADAIAANAVALLRDPQRLASMITTVNPYGDGKAGERIVEALARRSTV